VLICHCRAVSQTTIEAAILAGARHPEEVAARCGAGGGCGGCVPALVDLIGQIDAEAEQTARTSAA